MTTITVKGMSCQHCVNAVAKALGGIDGIQNVEVSLEKGQATFTEAKPVAPEVIKEALKKAGYEVG